MPSIEHYSNGQLFWEGQHLCDTLNWKGKPVVHCIPIGIWKYYYENGSLKEETFNHKNSRTKYVNMWLPDGKQILKNGEGFIYDIEYGGRLPADSSIYQIIDSTKQGSFARYRADNKGKYSVLINGFYKNGEMDGSWTFADTSLNLFYKTTYKNDYENGLYEEFYKNGKTKCIGNKIRSVKDSVWTYYNENGLITNRINYKGGNYFGEYAEYYSSGKIKITGQFVFRTGYDSLCIDDGEGNLKCKRVKSHTHPAMHGEWKYFNEDGSLLEVRKYKKHKLKNSKLALPK
ncbi:MAG: toxin-antitoxin system YwqK family antitoxin [Flavobacteriales bacterium]